MTADPGAAPAAPPVQEENASAAPRITPLDMARNCAANVLRIADAQASDPLRSHAMGWGNRGQQTAELAGHLALVAIAEDLHAAVGELARIRAFLEQVDR